MKLTTDEFNGLPLGDATLMSIAWLNDGRDVAVRLCLPDGRIPIITFEWVTRLRVDLHQSERQPYQPFSWDGSAKESGNHKDVVLDFAGQGSLSLACDSILAEGT
ncbi:MAG: hypothetical protein WD066_00220 [Planctomycetaceae bacterium]